MNHGWNSYYKAETFYISISQTNLFFFNQTVFTWLNAHQVDLDDITTKSIRLRLESDLNEKFEELKVGELTNVAK